jgi:hypothetical protein
MTKEEKLLKEIAEGLKNTDKETIYLLDIKSFQVLKTTRDLEPAINPHSEFIQIDPMLKDILEMMEDFALEQDTEEIQDHLLQTLKGKEQNLAVDTFRKTLLDYPRSRKKWDVLEEEWLLEQAKEILHDYDKAGNK